MGEAKRRKLIDPNYGKPKYLDLVDIKIPCKKYVGRYIFERDTKGLGLIWKPAKPESEEITKFFAQLFCHYHPKAEYELRRIQDFTGDLYIFHANIEQEQGTFYILPWDWLIRYGSNAPYPGRWILQKHEMQPPKEPPKEDEKRKVKPHFRSDHLARRWCGSGQNKRLEWVHVKSSLVNCR